MMELFLVAQPFTVTTFLPLSSLDLSFPLPVTELADRIGLALMAMFCISLLSLVLSRFLLFTIMLWVLALFL